MAKNTHYVVWVGRKPGIYLSWAETERQTKGFSGAKFKGFPLLIQAQQALQEGPDGNAPSASFSAPVSMKMDSGASSASDSVQASKKPSYGRPRAPYLAVDAAYSHKTKLVEWRGVLVTATGQKEVFRSKPYDGGSANVGEYLAIIEGIEWIGNNMQIGSYLPIYSDSLNAQSWVRRKAHASTVSACDAIKQMLAKADSLLQAGLYGLVKKSNPIFDWKTSQWGEIPADFGRK